MTQLLLVAQLKQEAAAAQQQFGQFDNMKGDAARAQEAIRLREQQAAQLAQCVPCHVFYCWRSEVLIGRVQVSTVMQLKVRLHPAIM